MTRGKENKPHIGIYGRRNNGKSSLINMLVGQDVAIVSDYAGTTTDPVKKSLEILNFGPVILIDTAGIDDEGELGKQRISKTIESIKHIDLGILLVVNNEWNTFEEQLVNKFAKNDLPYVIVHNKYDVRPISPNLQGILMALPQRPTVVEVSTKTGYGFDTLVE